MENIDIEQLREHVKAEAEVKRFKLPQGWGSRGLESLMELANEIEEFEPEDDQGNKVELAIPKVKGKKKMLDVILGEPKVMVHVPEDVLSKTNHVSIIVNGCEFIYARDQTYKMPKPIAEAYTNALKEDSKARKRMEKFLEIQNTN